MSLSLKFQWRGLVRAKLKRTLFDLKGLIAYNAKHPTYGLLTGSDEIAIANMQILLLAKVNAKVLR